VRRRSARRVVVLIATAAAIAQVLHSAAPTWAAFAATTSNAANNLSAHSSFYKATVTRDGPVGYWRLGETSGTVAVDSTGTSNGEYFWGYTQGIADPLVNDTDPALGMIAGGGIMIPDAAPLRVTQNFSIEAWIKPSSFATLQWIAIKNLDYYLYINDANGRLTFGFRKSDGVSYPYMDTAAFTLNTWQHVVGTYDGSKIVIYRNGVNVGQIAATGTNSAVLDGRLDVGHFQQGGGWYNGGLDELAVYAKALSASQVLEHYRRGALTQ
jgi:hypothetical protein